MASTYQSIATAIGNGSSGTITFSSIPSTYTNLVLVINGNSDSAGNDLNIRLNNDTGTNYSRTYLMADTTVFSSRSTNQTAFTAGQTVNYGVYVININNYSNSTTYKTFLTKTGGADNQVRISTGLWRSTAAVNRLDIVTTLWPTATTFTLYGIKAA